MLQLLLNQKNTWILPYLIITILGFLVFVVPCKKWNYIAEDYPIIYRVAKIKSFKDFCKIIFIEGNAFDLWEKQNPINTKVDPYNKGSFFHMMYRPGLLFISFVEYNLFGLNAFWIRFFSVLLHILNSILLLYILRKFLNAWISFLCTMIFTFNSTLMVWFGKIDTQQHHIELLFFLILCLCLIRLLLGKSNSIFLYFSIGVLYLFCLLIRETFIVLPIIGCLLFPFFYRNTVDLKKIAYIIGVMLIALASYIVMKITFYPLRSIDFSTGCGSIHLWQIMLNVKTVAIRFIQNLYSMLITVFINYKIYFFCRDNGIFIFYKIIKNLLLMLLGCLFIINTQKRALVLGIVPIILLSWPNWYLGAFGLRHYYELLPFGCLVLGILLQYNKFAAQRWYKIGVSLFFLPIILLNIATIIHFQRTESDYWNNFSSAVEKLRKSNLPELHDNPIMILNTKEFDDTYYNVGIVEAIQLNLMHNQHPKICIGDREPDVSDAKFKLFCKWVLECKSRFITLLIWNKSRDEFDVKVMPNLYSDNKQMT